MNVLCSLCVLCPEGSYFITVNSLSQSFHTPENSFRNTQKCDVKNVSFMYKQNISFVKLSVSKAFVSDYAVATKREYTKVAE